ncbi:MAG: peptidase domain-containing ABC transporter [Zoogloea oleivorans]|jgi:subfamily B ATP-binding cassette protein HlyB/CyaB|uniref:peptidase domain-containing ABC transporter n=1 Tax=Zoogloea oleivorans TaxID=1552750 RepID=UPI002A360EF1|nr:peptidase domain-containing ABC transporter [Zoogloea oleivorans]MDY0035160.1 peptidase domain-containing ABC transporter [Zoogloea oleivorans]
MPWSAQPAMQALGLHARDGARWTLDPAHFVWALGSLCALNRVPFDAELLLRQFPPPYNTDTLVHAARALGFRIKFKALSASQLGTAAFPCVALLAPVESAEEEGAAGLGLVTDISAQRVLFFAACTNAPAELSPDDFARQYAGFVFLVAREKAAPVNPEKEVARAFGFRWFIPELLRHRKVWRDVLLASLVIQLLALGTPLFTQTIIDKVVVHRTESTLAVIAIGMAVFMVFSALLTWVRQYLVLHTGNRVDAVLAAAVFEHLFRLPPRYFEKRPTGVISARLNGVETIREFVAGAAVTLMLDLPFLLIFVGVMLTYSLTLTLIVMGILGAVVVLSLLVAPMFQAQLNQQFLLGARNQAFLTEYVAGIETVKSLQMEPQLKQRYADYLAEYLSASFRTRQFANTYSTAASALEQLMSLLILVVGAWTVMQGSEFTIGMLVAFQMFAGKVSQPMMRLVGLWQQFQQADLSVRRLGDLMNAPTEPYSLLPSRVREGKGLIEIEGLAFRHADNLPYLYRDFSLTVRPGSTVAIMGASGSGKSTLAKLLQGFYQPADGRIRIDGTDIGNLSANELRHYFGVVPQETVLFSGTIYDNLLAANPHASFEQIVHACKLAEIHLAIEQQPQGYQTAIGERGAGLSGGQRQRLAIARALLKQPKILIFDEATSALDPQTAEHFAITVNQLQGKVTMLFITHALPRSLRVDEVVRIGAERVTVLSGERAGAASQERAAPAPA